MGGQPEGLRAPSFTPSSPSSTVRSSDRSTGRRSAPSSSVAARIERPHTWSAALGHRRELDHPPYPPRRPPSAAAGPPPPGWPHRAGDPARGQVRSRHTRLVLDQPGRGRPARRRAIPVLADGHELQVGDLIEPASVRRGRRRHLAAPRRAGDPRSNCLRTARSAPGRPHSRRTAAVSRLSSERSRSTPSTPWRSRSSDATRRRSSSAPKRWRTGTRISPRRGERLEHADRVLFADRREQVLHGRLGRAGTITAGQRGDTEGTSQQRHEGDQRGEGPEALSPAPGVGHVVELVGALGSATCATRPATGPAPPCVGHARQRPAEAILHQLVLIPTAPPASMRGPGGSAMSPCPSDNP